MSDPASDAAAAARRAERRLSKMPNTVLGGQPIGECPDCGTRFDYGRGTDTVGFDPCPECGSREWHKWGYRYNGEEIRRDEAWDQYDAPPSVQGGQKRNGRSVDTDTVHTDRGQIDPVRTTVALLLTVLVLMAGLSMAFVAGGGL